MQHIETVHQSFGCTNCGGERVRFADTDAHYLTSRSHPKCMICKLGFRNRIVFDDVRESHLLSRVFVCWLSRSTDNVV